MQRTVRRGNSPRPTRGLILGKGGGPEEGGRRSTRDRSMRRIATSCPLLGTRKVADLSRADVTRFMREVAAGKTAVVAENRQAAREVDRRGREGHQRPAPWGCWAGSFRLPFPRARWLTNPVHGVKRPADQRRTARLTPETYPQLGVALDAHGGSRCEPIRMAWPAIRLLALTGLLARARFSSFVGQRSTSAGHALRLADSKEGASVRPVGASLRSI